MSSLPDGPARTDEVRRRRAPMPVATGAARDHEPGVPPAGPVAPDRASSSGPSSDRPVGDGAPADLTRRPRRTRRAGRDLPAAIGVGVGMGVVVIGSLVWRRELFVGVVALAVCLALSELVQAFATRRIAVPLVPLLVGAVGMQVSAFVRGPEALLVAFVLTALGVVVWRVLETPEGAVRDVAAAVFAAAYVPFLAGFAVLMLAEDDGAGRIFVFVVMVVASDVGGYAFGVVWGRHPMAPSVSPKKSWEGSAGSALFTTAAGVAGVVLLLDGPWWAGALTGLAATVTATGGDLSESLLKRDLGIKDMGSLLPGHGGIMDRLDSLLPTAPVVYLLLAALVPVAA